MLALEPEEPLVNGICNDRPDWHRASTLRERAATLHDAPDGVSVADFDADLAERRLRRWRSQAPFDNETIFGRRLAVDGLDQTSFRRLLGASLGTVRERCLAPPAWRATLAAAFSQTVGRTPFMAPPEVEQAELLAVAGPLIEAGRARLRARLGELPIPAGVAPDLAALEVVLFAGLPASLLAILGRTLVLELNAARIHGRLSGETPRARYQSFVEQLADPEIALAIFDEYPVMARHIVRQIDSWVETSAELVARLAADWSAICERFPAGEAPGPLAELTIGAGDVHRGGRSVSILRFDGGLRLVYKPRRMAADAHFQDVLAWLNERGDHLPFRTLTVLDRGAYGWVEYVAAAGCHAQEEVRRFYERQGGNLALLSALAASDLHFENIIAAGEHPVLLDLEALFHPRLASPEGNRADELADRAMGDSVMGVGLLPDRRWEGIDSDGIDVSGLGALGGQTLPRGEAFWEAAGTDEIHYGVRSGSLPPGQNRPTLEGADTNPLEFADAIVEGFERVYRTLEAHRDELLREGGILDGFAGDEVRVIARSTQIYGLLLQAASHPDTLRDGLDQERLLDRLWVGIRSQPQLEALIPAEHRDIEARDIPVFTTRPDSRDVWTSRGERLTGLLDEPGLARARRRVERLGEADLERQRWFIRASLATLANGAEQALRMARRRSSTAPSAEPGRLLAAAQQIGDRLAALAIRDDDGGASWIGLTLSSRSHWSLRPLWLDLYDGLPGIALFLAQLSQRTGEERHRALALRATVTLRRLIERWGETVTEIGGFTGWGGMAYAFAHLGVLWQDRTLLDEAGRIVERLPALIDRDETLDIVGGAAGCIAGLGMLYRVTRSEAALAAAVRCGERLTEQAVVVPDGLGWPTRQTGGHALAGFAHGAAGIASALLQLDDVIGEPRFRSTALAAVEYERGLFVAETGNWPDLRHARPEQPSFMTAWCHGAPGIGLARLRSLGSMDDPATRAEIETALATTSACRLEANHSLCHGALGNLEPLLQAGRTLGPEWAAQASRLGGVILDDAEQRGWKCGTPLGVESPGLMSGLAGIGYGLLRLAAPDDVPSILSLEAPRLA
jgi:type 2 lantibiotic biosynthesis protein LanM